MFVVVEQAFLVRTIYVSRTSLRPPTICNDAVHLFQLHHPLKDLLDNCRLDNRQFARLLQIRHDGFRSLSFRIYDFLHINAGGLLDHEAASAVVGAIVVAPDLLRHLQVREVIPNLLRPVGRRELRGVKFCKISALVIH